MATFRRINPFSKANNDTGFGTNPSDYGGRFINRDGSFNLRKTGLPFFERFSLFHSMLNMPTWKFVSVIVVFFLSINFVYASIYFWIGAKGFTGLIAGNSWQEFKELYFFSTETFTTVGYGRVNPVGDGANLVAALEAMNGLLSFAVATGLIPGPIPAPPGPTSTTSPPTTVCSTICCGGSMPRRNAVGRSTTTGSSPPGRRGPTR